MRALVDQLKHCLRRRGITYAQVAEHLGMSESSIKRLFAERSFSLARLEQVCSLAGLEISDLVGLMLEEREYLTELTPEQEQALLADEKLLVMTYLLINRWTIEEIVATFEIGARDVQRMLIRLDRLTIIELLPFNRVKLLTSRNFSWRKDGPVQRYFAREVQAEFFDSRFAGPGEDLRFVGGMLSHASLERMSQAMERVAREFDELARADAELPLDERHGCSAVLAIRPWEFSVFTRLRRRA